VSGPNAFLADVSVAQTCADHLVRERDAILRVLMEFESHEAATEELNSSIDALRNLHRELVHLRRGSVPTVAVFLPINLPLYSLILFAAVPSLMAERVDVRLPAATPDWLLAVADAAGLDRFFPRMHLHRVTRRQFIDNFASRASAVVFTGRYESAEQVRSQCPHSLFIFQGSGVNPIVVGPDAELDADTLERMITTRVFNGGQDCAAPDVFLVHESQASAFVGSVVDELGKQRFGGFEDSTVRIGKILNEGPLKDIQLRLNELAADIVVGGKVDRDLAFVEPTVIVRPIAEHDELYEFFAPIFYVLVYENDEDLASFFERDEFVENSMYVSLFGQPALPGLFDTSTVLFEMTVLDVEQGNTAFGGCGAKSNYVALDDEVSVGPGLISEALARIATPTQNRTVSRARTKELVA
jgi:aldehyde dehydrogenase (NAD+)